MKSYCSKVICLGLLCLLVSTGIAVAQTWQKQVLASGGAQMAGGGYSIHFTLGEVVVATFDNDMTLHQGFQQGNLLLTAVENPYSKEMNLAIHPNPTSGLLYLQSDKPVRVKVTDIAGHPLFELNNVLNGNEIDLHHLASGVYFIVLFTGENQMKTYQIHLIR